MSLRSDLWSTPSPLLILDLLHSSVKTKPTSPTPRRSVAGASYGVLWEPNGQVLMCTASFWPHFDLVLDLALTWAHQGAPAGIGAASSVVSHVIGMICYDYHACACAPACHISRKRFGCAFCGFHLSLSPVGSFLKTYSFSQLLVLFYILQWIHKNHIQTVS